MMTPFPPDAYTLHWKELVAAAQGGLMRRIENILRGTQPMYDIEDKYAWNADIDGAIGEVVVARYLNLYWSPGQMRRRDLERSLLEVRASRYDDPCLILHRRDHDDLPYVCVWLRDQRGYISGWLYGAEGKRAKWWRTDVRKPAFFVPRPHLRPLTELCDALGVNRGQPRLRPKSVL